MLGCLCSRLGAAPRRKLQELLDGLQPQSVGKVLLHFSGDDVGLLVEVGGFEVGHGAVLHATDAQLVQVCLQMTEIRIAPPGNRTVAVIAVLQNLQIERQVETPPEQVGQVVAFRLQLCEGGTRRHRGGELQGPGVHH